MPSNHLILCHPLLLLPSVFPSSSSHQVPKYWSFSFSSSPSSEYSGLISSRMHWLDCLAVQGTFKSLLQHRSSKASVLWRSAFSMAQLSHLYTTAGNTIALTAGLVYSIRHSQPPCTECSWHNQAFQSGWKHLESISQLTSTGQENIAA